jgi:HK97 gp10 family phage protein
MARNTNINQVINRLRNEVANITDEIEAVTRDNAYLIEQKSKQLAPKNFGKLAQSISNYKSGELQYTITVNETYGAYMEFGTGTKVQVPNDFKEIAESFRGKSGGTFDEGLESIKAWCRAKGIDEKDAKWIFINILRNGIDPQPFLYPAYVEGKERYLNDLKALLRRNR